MNYDKKTINKIILTPMNAIIIDIKDMNQYKNDLFIKSIIL